MSSKMKRDSVNGQPVDFELIKDYDKDGSTVYVIQQNGAVVAKASLEWGGDNYEAWYNGPTQTGEQVFRQIRSEKKMRNITSVLRKVAEIWGA